MSDSMLIAPGRASRGTMGLPRLLQTAAALGLAAFAGLVAASGAGCKSTATTPPTPFCEGGFTRPAAGSSPATCEGLCSPSACADAGNADNVCVNNYCELQCSSILDCASGQDCVAAKTDGTGAAVTICQDNNKAAIGALCPFGTECATLLACPDGSACVTQNCPMASCKPLVCLTDGSGDASAYCTLEDCHADTDCPGGYWCETVRDPHQICGSPAPPAVCGTTTDPCVTLSMNTANGTTFAAGSVCTQRNECHLRRPCDPCTIDPDCSLTPGQHCVSVGGASVCAQDCASDADCVGGFQCTSGECVPRFGSCTGTGTFCEPCRDDAECATGAVCGSFIPGGERVCTQLGISCDSTNTSCPTAPDGVHGQCIDSVVNAAQGDPGYDTCTAPYNAATNVFGCWCGNTGTGCYVGTDCCNKTCTGADRRTWCRAPATERVTLGDFPLTAPAGGSNGQRAPWPSPPNPLSPRWNRSPIPSSPAR